MNRLLIALSLVMTCSGCGGSQVEETTPANTIDDEVESESSKQTMVSGLHATIQIGEVDSVFDINIKKLYACYEEGLEDLEDIEGTIDFAIEVGAGDQVTKVHIRRSNLGSLEAERCMLRRIGGFTIKRQGDGVAVASKQLVLEAPYDPPTPINWSAEIISKVVADNQDEVDQCLGGSSGIHLTIYVGKGGMVLSSGVATDEYDQLDAGACLAKAARSWKFPDPDSDLAKIQVSF